jgi:transcriptional regulator with XRE-family HTH domain
VARRLGISVVYYRDVERGQRRAFSAVKVDYEVLASVLDLDIDLLMSRAAGERGQLEFNFGRASKEERRVALLLARQLGRKKLAKSRLATLTSLLRSVR